MDVQQGFYNDFDRAAASSKEDDFSPSGIMILVAHPLLNLRQTQTGKITPCCIFIERRVNEGIDLLMPYVEAIQHSSLMPEL